MPKFCLYSDDSRARIKANLFAFIDKLPDNKQYQVVVEPLSKKRSIQQNRLQRQWCNDLATQGDMTAEQYRAHSKLHIGVPILRSESEDFKEKYDRIIKPLPYDQKLELMAEPFDFPVTRLMTKEQSIKYLDAFSVYWVQKGFYLTNPADIGIPQY